MKTFRHENDKYLLVANEESCGVMFVILYSKHLPNRRLDPLLVNTYDGIGIETATKRGIELMRTRVNPYDTRAIEILKFFDDAELELAEVTE